MKLGNANDWWNYFQNHEQTLASLYCALTPGSRFADVASIIAKIGQDRNAALGLASVTRLSEMLGTVNPENQYGSTVVWTLLRNKDLLDD